MKEKTFKCKFEAVGTELTNIPIFVEIQVTKIELNKTFFSIVFNFKDKSNMEIVKSFDINLKLIINKI